MPTKVEAATLSKVTSVLVQEAKSVDVKDISIGSIMLRPEQKIVDAFVLLTLSDDRIVEQRMTIAEGGDYDSMVRSFVESVVAQVKATVEAGRLG